MTPKRRWALGLALVGTAVALIAAACNGNGGDGDGGPPDAAEIYFEASEKMAALTSYHVTGENLAMGATQPSRFDLDFLPPDRFQVTFTEDGGLFRVTGASFIRIGDQFYFSPSDLLDYFILPDDFPPFGFSEFLTALTTQVSDLTYVAEETVEGVSTHHLQGSLAPAALAPLADGEAPAEGIAIELWVGVEDSLMHRAVAVGREETGTFTLSRFDEAITIEVPANAPPADLSVLSGLESMSDEERDCLRRVWGDAVFAELEAGARLPTELETRQTVGCFRN